jgi:hypothetical protein
MSESSLRPPVSRDVTAVADWLEATMAIEQRALFAKALIRRRLGADGNDDEAALSLALAEIRRRSSIAGAIYPYQVGGAGVRRISAESRVYDFLLMCSLDDAPFRKDHDWTSSVRLFEQLAVLALERVFGPDTRALRFGHPPEPPRPSSFTAAVGWLASELGHEVGPGRISGYEQDGGVDAVAWRPFREGYGGLPLLLAQCTLQRDFETKGSDIVLNRWRSWILFRRNPLCALVLPFALGRSGERWEDANFSTDVVLDRFRLCELLDSADLTKWPHARHLDGWLDAQFDALRLPA